MFEINNKFDFKIDLLEDQKNLLKTHCAGGAVSKIYTWAPA